MEPREMIAGAAGGFVQDVLMHPVDTVRARLQVLRANDIRGSFAALRHVVRQTAAQEGLRGFYGGYGTVFMFSMPTNAIYFASYSAFKRDYSKRFGDTSAVYLAAGFSAQICASILWTPFDVVKQRLQVQNQSTDGTGVVGMVRRIAAKDGWMGLYRGMFAGWAVWCPFSAVYFCTFERISEQLLWLQPTPEVAAQRRFGIDLLSGMIAGAIGGVFTQPLDALKTRLQVSQQQVGERLTVLNVLTTMLKEEGVAPLYRGVWGRVLWLAPGTGITIAVFSLVESSLAAVVP
jgi:hypothetical protein